MRKRTAIIVCLLVVSLLVASAVVVAKKPPKPPPDPPQVPAGTIYYQQTNDGVLEMWSMLADGSEKTKLGVEEGVDQTITAIGEMSRLKHGDHYWFIRFELVGGSYPDGLLVRELFAVRDDNAVKVQLTDDPTLETLHWAGRVLTWGIDDESIGWAAKRWIDGELDMNSFGIYSAGVIFDANGDIVSLSEEPQMIWETGTHSTSPPYAPNIKRFDWSPDGSKIVMPKMYHGDIMYEIFIVDIQAQTETDLGTTGYRVRWSPDGSKIAFIQDGSLLTINPDGTDEQVIVAKTTQGKTVKTVEDRIGWSPDSSHLVYTWHTLRDGRNGLESHNYVYRVEANGDNPTCMTDELPDDAYPQANSWR